MSVPRSRAILRIGLLVLPLAVAAMSASATGAAAAEECVRFAAPTGSDTNAGTLSSPYKTSQRLLDSLAAGETGCLRAGTYAAGSDGYVLKYPRAGTQTAPIRVRSYPGERARLVGIVYVPATSDSVALSDVDIEGDGSMNTIKIYSSDVVIERNDITNRLRGQSCMMLGSSSAGQAQRTIVRSNRFHDCGSPLNTNKDHSIYASNTLDARITDNVFTNSAGYTIQLYPNAQRTLVAHNVIDGGPDTIRGGIVIGGDSNYASRDNVVERNVITYAATDNIYSYWPGTVGTGNVARDNCLFGAGDDDVDGSAGGLTSTNNTSADPRFIDRSTGDYRLALGSPCLAVVGYDTAAMLLAGTVAPPPAPVLDTQAPTASWTAPVNGQPVTGTLNEAAGNCAVEAGDNVGVAKVEFLLDGAPLNVDTAAPFACAWNTAGASAGAHVLKAVATDAAGNATGASVSVSIAATAAPNVTLLSPSNGSTFKRSLLLEAGATDDTKITKVEFRVDGTLVHTETGAPYEASWSAKSLSYAKHTVVARAYDSSGLTTNSATATVTRIR